MKTVMTIVRNRLLIPVLSLAVVLGVSLPRQAAAEESAKVIDERMIVDGDTLTFNTDAFRDSETQSARITYEDDNLFGDMIMNFPEVTTVVVQGGGGNSKAGMGIARKIMEFGLDTVARNRCASSCSTIFLAGRNRELAKGGLLCFHRAWSTSADLRSVYLSGKKTDDWLDEFEFAEDVFDNGQIATRDYIEFLVLRGVSLEFALKTLAYSANDSWCPSREELEEGGVLRGSTSLTLP